jgi:nucleoside-diphosphate-sugar epimerase
LTDFWTGRPTLVTGGAGFLGAWVVHKLLIRGANVVCLVHERGLPIDIIGHHALFRVKTVRGDIRNKAQLESILKEHSIATLFHFAAKAIVGIANTDPAPTLETNILGAIALLEACRRCPDLRQTSSAKRD